MNLLIINGPNINMIGIREPGIYGSESYADLLKLIDETASSAGISYKHFQSNHEGAIVDEIQAAYGNFDGIIINPAAYTHTSVAIHDAIKAVTAPVVETHISNVYKREEFRHKSIISSACVGVIGGFGLDSYRLGVEALLKLN